MHLTCTLRARAIAQLLDIRIQFFQLISSIPCQDSLCQLRRKSRKFSKRTRTHGSFVYGPLFGPLTLEFNFSNWSRLFCVSADHVSLKWQHGFFPSRICCACTPLLSCTVLCMQVAICMQCAYKHRKILEFSYSLKQAVLTKDRRSQLKTKTNSKVRGLNDGPCTQGACVRARLKKSKYKSF